MRIIWECWVEAARDIRDVFKEMWHALIRPDEDYPPSGKGGGRNDW